MTNLIRTTKYFLAKTAISAMIFAGAFPIVVSAQYYDGIYPGYDIPGYDIPGYDIPTYDYGSVYYDPTPTYNYDPTPTYNYDPTPTYNYDPTPTYNYDPTPTYNYDPTPTYNPTTPTITVISGGVSGGVVYSGGGYGYGYYGGGVVTSGGAWGGIPAQPVTYTPSGPSTVSSGSVSGGNPAQPATYNLTGPSTVYSGGTNYYYPVTGTYVPNQVLSYTDVRDPMLSSVYLSDVPYTGAGDNIKIALFILTLFAWSFAVAFYFMKKKADMQFVFEPITNKQVESLEIANESYALTGFDSSDIDTLSNYARANKVLLSTDASKKLVKLERLGKADSKKLIDQMTGSEWTAIGEKDIEKYL